MQYNILIDFMHYQRQEENKINYVILFRFMYAIFLQYVISPLEQKIIIDYQYPYPLEEETKVGFILQMIWISEILSYISYPDRWIMFRTSQGMEEQKYE